MLFRSGSIPDQPAELLQSVRMAEIIQGARSAFDFVIIDLPPVLGLADTLAVAPLLDGVLFVAQADNTRQVGIRHAVAQLQQVGAVIDGGVLNDVVASRFTDYKYGYEYARPNGSQRGRVKRPSSEAGDRATDPSDEAEVATERPRPKP